MSPVTKRRAAAALAVLLATTFTVYIIGRTPTAGARTEPVVASLRALATHTREAPGHGPVTAVHLHQWSMETTSPDLPPVAQDVRMWWDQHRYGCLLTQPLNPGGNTTLDGIDCYADFNLSIPGGALAPAEDWRELAAQLASIEPPSNGPQATVRAIASLYRTYALTAAQRTTALTLLAAVPGLTAYGTMTDRSGRTGTAYGIDTNKLDYTTRDTLIFDAGGQLLAHEYTVLTPLPAIPGMHTPAVASYTLILDAAHVDALPGSDSPR